MLLILDAPAGFQCWFSSFWGGLVGPRLVATRNANAKLRGTTVVDR